LPELQQKSKKKFRETEKKQKRYKPDPCQNFAINRYLARTLKFYFFK
tara:strand:- start:1084 stop:1224 length:141 start_codon:yes stop_codon:yes gene_type:complete